LRADIDYATATAHTTYGCIGVKVWICRGEIHKKKYAEVEAGAETALGIEEKPAESRRRRARRKKQPDSQRRPQRTKPSAKALDKSRRRKRPGDDRKHKQPPPAGREAPSGDDK
jgi:ribosomal protein S3